MKYPVAIPLLMLFFGCSQSTMVFEPSNNKPVPATTAVVAQNTVTLNITLPTPTYATTRFSALLFRDGVLVAGMNNNDPAAQTAAGVATVVLNSVNVATNCIQNGTPAALENGFYNLHVTMAYPTETPVSIAPPGCGATAGLIASSQTASVNNLSGLRADFSISGNFTYTITSVNALPASLPYSFRINDAAFANKNFRCYVLDVNTPAPSPLTQAAFNLLQPIAYYTGAIDGAGLGVSNSNGAARNQLNAGTYKYYCFIDIGSNGGFFDTSPPVSADKYATGTATVPGTDYTNLNSGNFQTVPP